jgi:hypothetical protein
MKSIGSVLLALAAVAAVAACSSQTPPPPPVITVSLSQSSPPPSVVSTPVPVVRAKSVPGQGRPDPFVALYGPPGAASSTPAKAVSVSSFPKIPTLPGFTTGPGGVMHSIWDGVSLTGIVRGAGYTAIVQVDDQSYIVRQGEDVAGKFLVSAIGPDFVSLEYTGTPRLVRTFSLGG